MPQSTTDLLTLHGGPADGARYRRPGNHPLPQGIEVALRLMPPEELIDSTPLLALQGEAHAVYRYVRRGNSGDYDWQDI